jgi:hypothetical protein
LLSPYRTLLKALQQGLRFSRGQRLDVDITDLAETGPIVWKFPTFDSDLATTLDGNSIGWWVARRGAVNIFATPTTEITITAGEVVSQTAQPAYDHLILTHTHPGIAAAALVGKLFWGTGGTQVGGTIPQVGRIVANTATTIQVAWSRTGNGAMTAPLYVGVPSAVLDNPNNVICLNTGVQRASITFSGVALTTLLEGSSFANQSDPVQSLHVVGCSLQGTEITGGGVKLLSYEACTFSGSESVVRGTVINCALEVNIGQCRFRRINDFGALAISRGVLGRVQWNATELSACAAFGAWDRPGSPTLFNGIYTVGGISVSNSWFHDGLGPETQVFLYGPVRVDFNNVQIDNCSSTDGAIVCRGNCYGTLFHVTGTGNTGTGVQLRSGAKLENTVTTTITGTIGDMKVGGNAVQSWAVQHPAGFETDSTQQLCAMIAI